jgi:hypothetical protein
MAADAEQQRTGELAGHTDAFPARLLVLDRLRWLTARGEHQDGWSQPCDGRRANLRRRRLLDRTLRALQLVLPGERAAGGRTVSAKLPISRANWRGSRSLAARPCLRSMRRRPFGSIFANASTVSTAFHAYDAGTEGWTTAAGPGLPRTSRSIPTTVMTAGSISTSIGS